MTAGTLPAQPAEGHEPIPTHATGMPTPMVGMLLFIASEVMFFGGLFATYFNARASVGPDNWHPPSGTELDLPECNRIWREGIDAYLLPMGFPPLPTDNPSLRRLHAHGSGHGRDVGQAFGQGAEIEARAADHDGAPIACGDVPEQGQGGAQPPPHRPAVRPVGHAEQVMRSLGHFIRRRTSAQDA